MDHWVLKVGSKFGDGRARGKMGSAATMAEEKIEKHMISGHSGNRSAPTY
jgi:hypothetical protein